MMTSVKQPQTQALSTTPSTVAGNKDGQNLPNSATEVNSASSRSEKINLDTAESLSDIAQKYNIRNMSPREMSDMSQELYQKGAISFQDHALLSFQPELGFSSNENIHQADIPKDFIAHWEQQLQLHEQHGERAYAENDKRILNILSNIDTIAKANHT
ncbi:hypothetical protein [Desulfogranum japonicum]|uniref:hypothetical protein n=1 Tax=Desulfogranum japonicum TaxID=231447 RepID=UPI0004188C56|nr:hypothetical protein [Desulfogranum japonicum]